MMTFTVRRSLLGSLVALLVFARVGGSSAADLWTLERAVNFAQTNSPDARIAQHRVIAARAGLEQANAAFWPRLQLQSSYARMDNPIGVFGAALNQRSFASSLNFNDVPDADNLNARGVLTVPLYTGGRSMAGREAAKANTEAAHFNREAVRQTLAFEVTRSFFTVLKTRQFIEATEASVRSFEKNLVIASNRFNAGTSLKTEMLDLVVRLAQAREDRVRARNAKALSERVLRNLLGLEGGEITVTDAVPATSVPTGREPERRPELAAVTQRQIAADAEVRRARAGYRPRVSAFGSLDYDRGWKFDGDGKSYTAGLLAQWDLWDGRLTRGQANEARANREALEEEGRRLRLAIQLEVEHARLALEESAERFAVTEAAIAQAVESVELTRSRFEQGLALSTQLIDAETALTSARVRRAEAEADQHIAIAALRKALGLPQLDSSSASP